MAPYRWYTTCIQSSKEVYKVAKVLNFIDTTTRDGSQSNWAAGMPVGMMEAVLEDIDKAGFRSLCCPLMQLQFKKVIRDLKEDPWEMVRMFAEKVPRTKKGCILQPSLWPFDIVNFNRDAVELFTPESLWKWGLYSGCRLQAM